MKTCTELQTMAVSYQEICAGADPWLPLGNFMNDFFGNFTEQRAELLLEPLQLPDDPSEHELRWAVFCIASVEYLSLRYDLPIPAWINYPAYRLCLDEAWYQSPGAHKPNVRERLQRDTPEPFARRNVYCGGRVFANKYELAAELRQRRSA
ncbi:hypothetical protein [Dictyobacter arantiisoli]|uniref:Uncharacterized protein n=1 Tax=Dictyobacter arantiisoli TaxID=2014874 RepID=A0A5A5TAH5_9CHLR|nr:hypothetical protein [Dictyobacter arantiisoli]GCF08398.1 hypothetical protein KDI_19620 [Dictyobacter arantiisoli]